jgi:hypothetical protein
MIGANDPIYRMKLTQDDWATLSWLNRVDYGSVTTPDAEVQGADYWRIYEYNGDTFVNSQAIANTIANGGGPNAAAGDGTAITYPYAFESFQVSPNNSAFTLNPNTTHYYAFPEVYTPAACISGPFDTQYAWTPVRVDVVEPECLDYDHIQVSWQNSFGFRDYFTFTKRNEKRVNAKRNTYYKNPIDYNATSLDIATYNRGETVFSQELTETYTAKTGFMDDVTAEWLENLYRAADVRVRFGQSAQWFPAILTSNTFTQQTYRKDGLFQYEIQFRLAHPLKTQRG